MYTNDSKCALTYIRGDMCHKLKLNCVVPENIHTPPTEGCLQFEPPPPRIFRSRGLQVAPPYPLEFP